MDDRESVTDSSCTLPIVEKYMFQIKMNYSLKPAVLIGASGAAVVKFSKDYKTEANQK